MAESLVSAADLLIKLFEANVPTCLAHAVTLSKKFDVALVQTSESDGVTSVYLAWLLRHGYVAYAQRMILERKVGLKPWATAGARPGLRTLEAATDLFPTNKDLLLCILRNLPTSTDEASEQRDGHTISFYGAVDELRARAILQRLVKRKADMLVCITFVSLWKVMFSHIDRRKNEDDDKKPWGGMLMYRILSRIDLSFQERRAWMTIFCHVLQQILPADRFALGNGEWVQWARVHLKPRRTRFWNGVLTWLPVQVLAVPETDLPSFDLLRMNPTQTTTFGKHSRSAMVIHLIRPWT